MTQKAQHVIGGLVAALVVVGTPIMRWLRTEYARDKAIAEANPFPPGSRAFLHQRRILMTFFEAKEYRAKTIHDILDISTEISAEGLRRLEPEQLADYYEPLSRALEKIDLQACGRISRGQAKIPEDLLALQLAVGSLDDETVDRQFSAAYEAMRLGLAARRGSTAIAPQQPGDFTRAIELLDSTLAQEEFDRHYRTLANLANASDEDACWAWRVMLAGGTKLTGADRAEYYRGFVNRPR